MSLNYQTLTAGDVITITHNNRSYKFNVLKIKPPEDEPEDQSTSSSTTSTTSTSTTTSTTTTTASQCDDSTHDGMEIEGQQQQQITEYGDVTSMNNGNKEDNNDYKPTLSDSDYARQLDESLNASVRRRQQQQQQARQMEETNENEMR